MLADLVLKNRSYRRFDESADIDETLLRECVDLARLSASGANAQHAIRPYVRERCLCYLLLLELLLISGCHGLLHSSERMKSQ